ncbi:MAG: crotonase/enoyl-CoA hydratase family protein [Deltaproteobacteria bacterium]|nr:crotonase/enoyl-CoA hydratase family protein [Deltaproteobacteria bacterium]MCB9786229.1 crotonase/enoyl-CoA hydratase family protein [Deltaproteobacteria bacterium]
MSGTLHLERDGAVATVTLAARTMAPAFFDDLGAMMAELAADAELRAVVLRGSERCFSYGLDLPATFREHGALFSGGGLAAPRTELLRLIRRWQASMTTVAELPVPVIAAVHGHCIGGGLDLISACDVRLASADATFSLREARVAIIADLGSLQRLPPIIGQGHTRQLAFTGADIGAERARTIGLVNDVYADRQALDVAARALAAEIAANPPLTVRGIKEVLAYGDGRPVRDGLEYVAAWNAAFLQSEDLGEAVSAFMGKRPPAFKGR